MKHAYVSVVIPLASAPTPAEVESLDAALSLHTRTHEIVVVTPYSVTSPSFDAITTSGPISIVSTHMRATPDAATIAGLARAVGDFIIEWRGPIGRLSADEIERILDPTDFGSELVEVKGVQTSRISASFYRFVNSLRPKDAPVVKTVARLYSRHALGQVLAATAFEPQLDILTAELPVQRSLVTSEVLTPHRPSRLQRLTEGIVLLSKGTRFGSAIPLTLAAVSAFFGIGAAIYALGFLLLRGQTPEGWTTLMVVTGLGQAAILAMLGLTWTRIDALARGLSRSADVTATVQVSAPRLAADTAKPPVS